MDFINFQQNDSLIIPVKTISKGPPYSIRIQPYLKNIV